MAIVDYERSAETAEKLVFSDVDISQKNKKDLRKYLNALDVTPARKRIILMHIKVLFHKLPDVTGSMKDRDLINKTFKQIEKEIQPGYYETVKNVSKAFVRWHNDGETPKGWKDIKANRSAQKRKLTPDDMITWDEGKALAKASNSVQMKAIIMCQLEGGFRPSEFIDLNYGDCIKGKNGIIDVHVRDGKTGERVVFLLHSAPALQAWLEQHPCKEKNAPLWVQETIYKNSSDARYKGFIRYGYDAIKRRIEKLAVIAKLEKPIDFYNFRHSAAYHHKMSNTPPEVAAKNLGHSLEYYENTYARLSPDDDRKRFAEAKGVTANTKDKALQPIECERCGRINEPGKDVCIKCSSPLTLGKALAAVEDAEQTKREIAELREQQRVLMDIILRKEKAEVGEVYRKNKK